MNTKEAAELTTVWTTLGYGIPVTEIHMKFALAYEKKQRKQREKLFTDCWDRLGRRIHNEDLIIVYGSISRQPFKAQVRLEKGAFRAYYEMSDEWDFLFDVNDQCELTK